MKTIREWLALFGQSEGLLIETPEFLDVVCSEAKWVPFKDGRIQAFCGGECIVSFTPAKNNRLALYLVRDDMAGEAWFVKRQEANKTGEVFMTPRPSPVLRLVQAA